MIIACSESLGHSITPISVGALLYINENIELGEPEARSGCGMYTYFTSFMCCISLYSFTFCLTDISSCINLNTQLNVLPCFSISCYLFSLILCPVHHFTQYGINSSKTINQSINHLKTFTIEW